MNFKTSEVLIVVVGAVSAIVGYAAKIFHSKVSGKRADTAANESIFKGFKELQNSFQERIRNMELEMLDMKKEIISLIEKEKDCEIKYRELEHAHNILRQDYEVLKIKYDQLISSMN